MITSNLDEKIRLLDATQKIVSIYLKYGQVDAAQKELSALGRTLQGKGEGRRGM